jgi:hypothetical protein
MKLKTVKLKMFKFKNCSNFKIFKFENTYFKKIQIKSKVENHKKTSKPKLLRTSSQTGKKIKNRPKRNKPLRKIKYSHGKGISSGPTHFGQPICPNRSVWVGPRTEKASRPASVRLGRAVHPAARPIFWAGMVWTGVFARIVACLSMLTIILASLTRAIYLQIRRHIKIYK